MDPRESSTTQRVTNSSDSKICYVNTKKNIYIYQKAPIESMAEIKRLKYIIINFPASTLITILNYKLNQLTQMLTLGI